MNKQRLTEKIVKILLAVYDLKNDPDWDPEELEAEPSTDDIIRAFQLMKHYLEEVNYDLDL